MPSDALLLAEKTLAGLRVRFEAERRAAERALAQVDDAQFFGRLVPHAEPLAVLVKHVGGNLRSRWTDVLTTDGDKPDRHRDSEFELYPEDTREALMGRWQTGWDACLGSLHGLSPADLQTTVTVRGEPMTLLDYALRSLAHTAGHVGQIVLLAKAHAGEAWQTLTIPRGESEAYGAAVRARFS